MSNSKIVDLQKCEDGTYSPKNVKTKAVTKQKHKYTDEKGSPKYVQSRDVDEFLGGLDAGLDFVEAIKVRAIRIMGLRD